MYFVPDILIKLVAESVSENQIIEQKLKFNWDNFQIRLSDFYSIEEITQYANFSIKNLKIDNIKLLKDFVKKENRYLIFNIEKIKIGCYDSDKNSYKYLKAFKYIKWMDIEGTYKSYLLDIIDHFSHLKHVGIRYSKNLKFINRNKKIESIKIKEGTLIDAGMHENVNRLSHICLENVSCNYKLFFESLKNSKNIKNITILNSTWGYRRYLDLHYLRHFTDLETLKLQTPTYCSTFFPGLKNLKELNLTRCDNDLDFIKYSDRLEIFEIRNIKSLEPFKELKNLKILILGEFNGSLEPLKNLTKLKKLHLMNQFNQPLDPIKKLKYLEDLHLGNYFNKPIEPIINLNNLKKLYIGNSFNGNIGIIKNFKKLEYLYIGSAYDGPIDPIKNLRSIRTLILKCRFRGACNFIKNFKNLEEIDFPSNFNRDIDFLLGLKRIKYIHLPSTFQKCTENLKTLRSKIYFH